MAHIIHRCRLASTTDYWIIDADSRAFEVWHPEDERPALVDDRLIWRPANVTEPFAVDVQRFFDSTEEGAPLA